MLETISSALIATGLTSGLILVLGILCKESIQEWLVTRIRSGIQHDFDSRLETHKAELAIQTEEVKLRLSNDLQLRKAFLDTVRSAFFEGQKSSMERKLVAVDKIWDEVVQLRKLTLPAMSIVDVFKSSETQKFREVKESELGSGFLHADSLEENKNKLHPGRRPRQARAMACLSGS